MPQSTLNKKWFHKLTNYFYPNNCRAMLELAVAKNKEASTGLFNLIHNHEKDVVHALKSDLRHVRK